MPRTHNVLFVCWHGSAKSVIAAAFANRLAAERGLEVRASSAGTEPDQAIPLHVAELLLRDGIDVREQVPVGVTNELIRNAERVVSFGCDLSRLDPPLDRTIDWNDVPAVSDGYGAARDEIVRRLGPLLDDIASANRF